MWINNLRHKQPPSIVKHIYIDKCASKLKVAVYVEVMLTNFINLPYTLSMCWHHRNWLSIRTPKYPQKSTFSICTPHYGI